MKIKTIHVSVDKAIEKKTWKDNCSKGNRWGLTYGADADLSKRDDPIDSIIELDNQLRLLIAERLSGGTQEKKNVD